MGNLHNCEDGKIESIYVTIKVLDLNFIMQKFILKYFFALILFPSKRFKKFYSTLFWKQSDEQ